jgi:hypothetical protein
MAGDSVDRRLKRRRLPNVDVPAVADQSLRQHLEGVKEHLRMYEGDSGAPKERFVTIDELEAAGLIATKIKRGYATITEAAGQTVPTVPSQSIVAVAQSTSGGGGGAKTFKALDDTSVAGITAGQGIRWNGTFYVPTELPTFNLGLAEKYDMLFRDTLSWKPSVGQLQWNPDLNYLQLANAHSINWLDASAVSVSLLDFSGVAIAGALIDVEIAGVDAQVSSTSTSYVSVTGATLDHNNLVDGDDYLLVWNASMGCSTANTNGDCRLVDQSGALIPGSEYTYRATTASTVAGMRYGFVNVFTADSVTGTGNFQMEFKHATGGSVSAQASHVNITAINLTALGVGNYINASNTATTGITSASWATVESVVLPTAGDWLIFGCANTANFNGNHDNPMRLHDGTSTISTTYHDLSTTAGKKVHNIIGVVEGASASQVITLGMTAVGGIALDAVFGSIVAIRLDAMADYQVQKLADPADPVNDTPYVLDTLSFTAAGTGNYIAFGAVQDFFITTPTTGYIELQAQVNAGGYTAVGGSDTYAEDYAEIDATQVIQHPTASFAVSNGDAVDVTMNYTASDSTPTLNQITNGLIVVFLPQESAVLSEDFVLGDSGYYTRIDGTTVTVRAPMNVDGAVTLDTTLGVTGAATFDGVTLVTDYLSVETTGAANHAGFYVQSDDTAAYSYSGVFNTQSSNYIELQSYGDTAFGGLGNRIQYGGDDLSVLNGFHTLLRFEDAVSNQSVNLQEGTILKIWDSTDTDHVDFEHNGTDFLITGTGTSAIEFVAGTDVNFNDNIGIVGTDVTFWSPDLSKVATLSMGNDGIFDFFDITGLTDWYFEGNINARLGSRLYVYDDTNTDYNYLRTTTGAQAQMVTTVPVYIYSEFDVEARYSMRFSSVGTYLGLGYRLTLYDLAGTDQLWMDDNGTASRIVTTVNPLEFYTANIQRASVDASGITLVAAHHVNMGAGSILFADDGTAAAPSIASALANTTGFYWGGDAIGVSAAGTQMAQFDATQFKSFQNIYSQEGVSADGTVSDVGQVGIFAFIDQVSTYARVGSYNYDAPNAWAPLRLQASEQQFYIEGTQCAALFSTTFQFEGGIDVWVRDGGALKIFDATDTDNCVMAHNGTDFDFTFNGTTNVDFQGMTNIRLLAGGVLKIYDGTSADQLQISHDGTYANLNETTGVGFDFDLNSGLEFFIRADWVGSTTPYKMLERAAAQADSAGYGQIWIKNDAPCTLWYTDDASGDQLIDPSVSEINTQNGAYTLVLGDKGKTIHKATSTASITHTIPANASVAFPLGTLVAFKNSGTVDMTIAITSDTLTGTDGVTGSRTLGAYHEALIQKLTATTWSYAASDL